MGSLSLHPKGKILNSLKSSTLWPLTSAEAGFHPWSLEVSAKVFKSGFSFWTLNLRKLGPDFPRCRASAATCDFWGSCEHSGLLNIRPQMSHTGHPDMQQHPESVAIIEKLAH